ncbi:oxidoreductase [Angomonas deanei]|uniref:Zinc-binding dehydrogenase, putative n=1 Tax=Angomonas deanei TaxID=59799 RepID=A0A7G2BZS6_9TRYP|nr:oxidoreductase [Angomonas deanei]CAD2212960.1 Zinc-binding dehydrogenase, putative [Angomonas deanei]|eukprot:EPY38557.1 oxidoreductase [Angomonas deanei]
MADGIAVGTTVVFLSVGAFAEFVAVPRAVCQVVDRATPEYLALNVSGLTAAIALGELAGPALTAATPKKKVALVTAAAGGTGHLAVQLLKEVYHCTVVGTCSSPAKAHYLRDTLRCDHVIDYQTALAEGTLDRQLGEVAPEGFTVIYECVGGELFNTAVRHIAPRGVVLMIGAIVHYATGGPAVWQHPQNIPLSTLLLTKSASLKGFHLSQFTTEARQYGPQLMKLLNEKRIRVEVDAHALDTFHGIDQVIDAVEYIHSGRSMGR